MPSAGARLPPPYQVTNTIRAMGPTSMTCGSDLRLCASCGGRGQQGPKVTTGDAASNERPGGAPGQCRHTSTALARAHPVLARKGGQLRC